MTCFLDFWPNKSEVFGILVIKAFLKQNFGYSWPLLDFFGEIFLNFWTFSKLDLQYNVLLFF